MVVDIQIISEGLTSPADCSVSLADPSQAKPMTNHQCDTFCGVFQGSFVQCREDNEDRQEAQVSWINPEERNPIF